MNITQHNRQAWNKAADEGGCWSQPVSPQVIGAAKRGEWNIVLTPTKSVPRHWFGNISNMKVLCLASGGGQQAPVLAAAGAIVTSFDISEEQLSRDSLVADRHSLSIETVRGDMTETFPFKDNYFDLVFHPASNLYIPDVLPVWREAFRVLKTGGRLLSGFMNPAFYLFDHTEAERTGEYVVRHALPFSDHKDGKKEEVENLIKEKEALVFSHTLEDQIDGQLEAGFVLAGFYEDNWDEPLDKFMTTHMATLAIKHNFHQVGGPISEGCAPSA